MTKLTRQSIVSEKVELLRGGAIATNLLGTFGQSLKETRLTASLGYLLAMRPEPLLTLFGFTGRVLSVSLEMRHEEGRSDILVETSQGLGVIEAKKWIQRMPPHNHIASQRVGACC